MKLKSLFMIFIIFISINNPSCCFSQSLSSTVYVILSRKDLQTLVDSGEKGWGETPEDIFVNAFQSCLKRNTNQATITVGKDTKAVISIDQNKSKVELDEREILFGKEHRSNVTKKTVSSGKIFS